MLSMLSEWLPKRIVNKPQDPAGTVIDSAYWRTLWSLVIEQGDDTADTLKLVLDELYATAWHPTDGAAHITNPALYEDGAVSVQGQLMELLAHMDVAEADILDLFDKHADIMDGTLVPYNAARLGGELPAAYALATQITNLQGQIDNITAGEIAAFDHNDISARNAADAHPISAITDLANQLQSLAAAIPLTHASFSDKNDAASHAASAVEYSSGVSVASKIAGLEATIAGITGDIGELAHNDLASRNAADAHPLASITGLATALSGKQATITGGATTIVGSNLTASRALVSDGSGKVAAATTTATEIGYVKGVTSAIQTQLNAKQKSITSGTSNPSGGVDGDIYIKYA